MQPKRPRFNPLILALALAGVLMIWSVLGTSDSSTGGSTMSYSTVVHYFENNQVTAFTLDRNTSIITLTLKEGKQELPETTGATAATQASGGLLSNLFSSSTSSVGATRNDDGTVTVRYKLPYAYVFIENVQQYIDSYDAANPTAPMEYDYTTLKESIPWMEILFYLGMLGCTGFLLFSMMRGGAGGGGIMNVGKAKVKDEHENKKTATFADVAGEDEEKEELKEVVEFLKSPDKFNTLGARIPHGVLLVGPPGTGKTLLARACAGEAGVPFYSISGSDFVEMYVGVGASRVRDLFEQAKKNAPAIIFIDEIDAIGSKRSDGSTAADNDNNQTLNQLLVEMDGFDSEHTVILLAATNRPDMLDQALLRPGRFDRQITIGLPDMKGREAILKIHAKDKKLADDVDLKNIAGDTAGFTGAELENILNEAAIIATINKEKAITNKDIDDALKKVTVGVEKHSRIMSDKDKRLTAYHEAGHAIVSRFLETQKDIKEVSIIPRGVAGGYTMYKTNEDKYYVSKTEMLEKLIALLGGRASEKLILNDVSTGASNDFEVATDIAKKMVTIYGMSDKIGPLSINLEKDPYQMQIFGESIENEIGKEVKRLIDEAYAKAQAILIEHIDKLHELAAVLIEKEVISEEEFEEIFED